MNRDAPFGDRDDAAMDLGEFDEVAAETALTEAISDHSEDEDIVDTAAESLADIWRRKGKFDGELVATFHPAAKTHFVMKH